MTSSPLIAGPDWQSFVQPNTSKGGVSGTNLAIPSTSSPPPLARHWGPNSLGGEALQTPAKSHVQRRNSNITDPIGSRPGSRTEAGISPSHSSQFGISANSSGTSLPSSANSSNKRFNSRPSASAAAGVMAAANSAAARSRATSPAISSSDGHTSMMGLGTSYHQNSLRFDQSSSSPSFMTARSNMPGMEGVFSGSTGNDNVFLGDNRGLAGTPKLVVEEPESNGGMDSSANDSSFSGGNVLDNDIANTSSGDLTASFSGLMTRTKDTQKNEDGVNQAGQGSYTTQQAAPQPLRSDSSVNLPSSSFSSSSLNLPNEALLSPSAASGPLSAFGVGMNGAQNTTSNATPTNSGYPFPGGLSSPGANMNSMQSFGSFSDQSGITSPGADGFRTGSNTQSFGGAGGITADFDAQLISSRIIQELMDRVMKTENGLRDMNRQIVGLNRNVGLLLERTKNLSSHYQHQPMRSGSTPVNPGAGGAQIVSEEVRALSAQVSMLSASMSHVLGQNMTNASPAGMPFGTGQGVNTPLAGLGLAGGTPQMGSTSTVTTPQLGTFPGTPAYANGSRFGGMTNMNNMSGDAGLRIATNNNSMAHMDRNSRLSPRPGASPGPNSRRWSSMVPGTPDVSIGTSSQMTGGAMNPPDPGVVVTKWEHLNLHADLLRSILKYGLGPPNKIQQRALPFLLRGSDIIAQAPPTQERIASYVIPVLQLVLNVLRGEATLPSNMGVRGPMAIIISTTVDQATQAQRMAMGLGAALGIRVHIAAASSLDVAQEASALIQTQPQIVVGTPQKMMDLFNYLANNTKGAISLEDVRVVVLDEVDQLIARNLADHVSTLLRILPTPRVVQFNNSGTGANSAQRPGLPALSPSLPSFSGNSDSNSSNNGAIQVTTTDRQTAIFSNTVPQDVLNFAQSIHLRESVRVLVRREGGAVSNTANGTGVAGSPMVSQGQQSGNVFGASQGGMAGTLGSAGSQNNLANGPGSSISAVQPINALGASPANNHANPLSDPILSSLRGLRQYYLYVAVTTGGGTTSPNPNMGSQMAHAIEMKLDVITDLLEDIDFGHAVVYTSSSSAHEAVTYKLASKGIEALGLHRDMASTTRQQVLAKYRSSSTVSSTNYHAAGHSVVGGIGNQANENAALAALSGGNNGLNGSQRKKALVVHDVNVHPKDVHQVPLIVFYDLPKSVDDYKEKIACAASGGSNSRPSVCVNVVTGSGGPRGDIEMLRTLECHLGCKMAELPMNPAQILQF